MKIANKSSKEVSLVTIDYADIPLIKLMAVPFIYEKTKQLCKDISNEQFQKLIKIPSTLRQLMEIYEASPLGIERCEILMRLFAVEDEENPIFIEEQYPFLLESSWKLDMMKISSMKVDLTNKQESVATIRSICRGIQTVGHEHACIIELNEPINFDFEKIKQQHIEILENKNKLRICFGTEDEMKEFMKQILLKGTYDLGN